MSEIKVNSIKGVSASTAAISIDNSSGTCTANITNNLSNRNLIINGAMQVAERGLSSTSTGYQTIDRFFTYHGGTDEAPTYSQADVSSGTTPYTLGFRKSFKITNGNQTGGADASDQLTVAYAFEAQDIANSGWNYTSTSSNITISFWVKSSVAQEFHGFLLTQDGTNMLYSFSLGSLSADTWTKVTKTIPGNSNLQFDNDNGLGFLLRIAMFEGTNKTGSITQNQWGTFDTNLRYPNFTSTWYTTNDATFETTGLQIEVGSVATPFEHRSFADELTRCQRYYQQYVNPCCTGVIPDNGSKAYSIGLQFQTRMRAVPTLTITNAGNGQNVHDGQSGADIASLNAADRNVDGASIYLNLDSDLGNFRPGVLGRNDDTSNTTTYKFAAEI